MNDLVSCKHSQVNNSGRKSSDNLCCYKHLTGIDSRTRRAASQAAIAVAVNCREYSDPLPSK